MSVLEGPGMSYGKLPQSRSRLLLLLLAFVSICAAAAPSKAITVNQVDDFQDDTTQHWSGADPTQIPDSGPSGTGDFALHVTATGSDSRGGKLLAFNQEFQWNGNWTAAGVARIAMDVRNPNQFPLAMRVGISGPGRFTFNGTGDVHVSTNPILIPADNTWHSVVFPVLAADFTSLNPQSDITAALAEVTHLRILHNLAVQFVGAQVSGSFYVDNIRALRPSEQLPGDYNQDGAVDAADYVVWRKNNGSPGDYDTWKSNFGRSNASGAHLDASGLAISSVPEPGALLLLLSTMASLSAAVPRRRESAN